MMKMCKAIVASVAVAAAGIPMMAQAANNVATTAAPAAAKHYTTQDTTIGDLLADPAAKAVIDKRIPGFSDNPSISMTAGMTLRALQQFAPDKITDDILKSIDADLSSVPAK